MLAAVAVPSASVDSAVVAVALLVAVVPAAALVRPVPVRVVPALRLRRGVPQVPVLVRPGLRVLLPVRVVLALAAPARALPGPLPHRRSSRLPRVAVVSAVPRHLRVRRSSSAAMARSSPATVKPTYAR